MCGVVFVDDLGEIVGFHCPNGEKRPSNEDRWPQCVWLSISGMNGTGYWGGRLLIYFGNDAGREIGDFTNATRDNRDTKFTPRFVC